MASDAAAKTTLSPENVLVALAGLLGLNFLKEDQETPLHKNCRYEWSLISWEPTTSTNTADNSDDNDEDYSPEVSFSSFPSLSLERRFPEEQLEMGASFDKREDVAAHVQSLLSRPILVSNTPEVNTGILDNEMGGSDETFMASRVSDIPSIMMQNVFDSFSTLLNSRLRAHATFLARHGLALLNDASDGEGGANEQGIIGVEQKLETMLEIGRLISTNAIVTSFEAQTENAKTIDNSEGEGTCQTKMPLIMKVSIDISLPHPSRESNETVTVSFQCHGSITGIFSNPCGSCHLRVVEVDLNTKELLASMIEQASAVISCIVAMTNTLYSLGIPIATKALITAVLSKGEVAVVSPSLRPKTMKRGSPSIPALNLKNDDEVEQVDSKLLARESCESLVDSVLDDTLPALGSGPSKRAKPSPEDKLSQTCIHRGCEASNSQDIYAANHNSK